MQKKPPSQFSIGPGLEQFFTVLAEGGKLTEVAANNAGVKQSFDWSPDGKWIAYSSDSEVKSRLESVVWEVKVDSFLKNAVESKTDDNP